MTSLVKIVRASHGYNILKPLHIGYDLLATVCKPKKYDGDFKNGKYRICIYGGVAHGKVAYAQDMPDLKVKADEILGISLICI